MAELISPTDLRKQVDLLIKEAVKGDPEISKVYWFPAVNEVRLIEVTKNALPSMSEQVEPFYFPPDVDCGMPALSGVALVYPGEDCTLQLPEGWGSWSEAEIVNTKQAQ